MKQKDQINYTAAVVMESQEDNNWHVPSTMWPNDVNECVYMTYSQTHH